MFGGNKSDQGLLELIRQAYEFIQSQPEPEAWLKKVSAILSSARKNLPIPPGCRNWAGSLYCNWKQPGICCKGLKNQ